MRKFEFLCIYIYWNYFFIFTDKAENNVGWCILHHPVECNNVTKIVLKIKKLSVKVKITTFTTPQVK